MPKDRIGGHIDFVVTEGGAAARNRPALSWRTRKVGQSAPVSGANAAKGNGRSASLYAGLELRSARAIDY
jgi:hypothetical protein